MATNKISLKSLQLEINDIKEELKSANKELKEVKEELKELKREKQEGNTNIQNKKDELNMIPQFLCTKCEESFQSKKVLKAHMKTVHPKVVKCNVCEETFDENFNLELHIRLKHEESRNFECNQCGKTFVLMWRFRKHKENHSNQNAKKCHYFNNKKDCPFEEIGCMFEHSLSDMCIYNRNCKNKLCSNQHETDEDNIVETNEPEQFKRITYFPDGGWMEERSCEFCGDPYDHGGDETLYCSKCDFNTECLTNLDNHVSDQHVTQRP